MKLIAIVSLVGTALLALTSLVAQTPKSLATTAPLPKGWELVDLGGACAVRLSGEEVDTMLSTNNKGQVLLVAGRRDWSFPAGNIKLTLQFDSQPPRLYTGSRWNNLVLSLLIDDRDVAAMRKASSIRWHLPGGDYSATVDDVGLALDAAVACTRVKQTGKRGHP